MADGKIGRVAAGRPRGDGSPAARGRLQDVGELAPLARASRRLNWTYFHVTVAMSQPQERLTHLTFEDISMLRSEDTSCKQDSPNGGPTNNSTSERTGGTDLNPADFEQVSEQKSDPGPDPFDPASLRLSEDFAANLGIRKALLSVPIRKPDKSWFVRVHPDDKYRLQTAVVELNEGRGEETYLVAKGLWSDLAAEATFSPRALFTAVNRQGVLFLWPIRLPRADSRKDEWSRTALEAADMAIKGWVRIVANMGLGGYDVFEATGSLPDPKWPDVPFNELLRIAFKQRYIGDMDHPILKELRGEV
jgi:hypothetical protein